MEWELWSPSGAATWDSTEPVQAPAPVSDPALY